MVTMPNSRTRLNHFKTAGRIWRPAAGLLLGATILAIVVLAYTPPVSRDALTHHLALPKLYLEKGALIEMPDRVFSYYPMNLDLLYMLPLYLGNDILAKYIHFFFALTTALIIFRYLKGKIGSGFGLFGVLLFLTTPVVIKLSTTVYVDLGLAFFSTAALLSLLRWRTQHFRTRHLVYASIWCGLALGTKYHGLVVFFILTNLVLLYFFGGTRPAAVRPVRVLKNLIMFTGIALIIFSPWMIRNVVWKSNPVYPLFNSAIQSIVGQKADTAKTEVSADSQVRDGKGKKGGGRLNHFAYRDLAFKESGLEIALIPLRIFFQGQDNNPKYFDGALNPLILLLSLFAFAGISRGVAPEGPQADRYSLLFFAALFILIIFLAVDMRIRYILPAIPPLTILATFGLRNLVTLAASLRGRGRQYSVLGLICLVVAGFMTQNYRYLSDQFHSVQPLNYISGRMERYDYIAQFRPAIDIHRFAAEHLPGDARILGIYLGDRSYYSEREIVFGEATFTRIARQALDEGHLARQLSSQGFTHLLVRYDLLDIWLQNNFTDPERERVRLFFIKFAPSLFTGRGYGLHGLNAGR
jgi:hypothetical protein